MEKARFRLGLAIALLSYASWGLLSPVGKRLLDLGFQPLGLNAVRFAIAAAVVLVAIGPRRTRAALALLARREVLWANVLANASLTLFLYSLAVLPHATPATLGFYTAPLWTAAWAHARLGERVGWSFAPAAAGLLVGGYFALFGWGAPVRLGAWGMALAVGSGLVWAFYSVALRRMAPGIPLAPLMGASFVFAAAWFSALALAFEPWRDLVPRGAQAWGWLSLYVAVPTLASFILFNAALQRAPASAVNLLVGAELAFTAIFAAMLFGDAFTVWQVAGLALTLGSITAYLAHRARTPSPK